MAPTLIFPSSRPLKSSDEKLRQEFTVFNHSHLLRKSKLVTFYLCSIPVILEYDKNLKCHTILGHTIKSIVVNNYSLNTTVTVNWLIFDMIVIQDSL